MRDTESPGMGGTSCVPVLGVAVSRVNMRSAVERIGGWIEKRQASYVCVTGTHGVVECQRDPDLKRIHNDAGMVTPDGMPLVWLSHLAGYKEVERVCGRDLLQAVCGAGLAKGYRHYFYGGAEGVAERMVRHLRRQFPGLVVAGVCSPPFGVVSKERQQGLVEQINEARPDVVWVGLGAPKQERWMAQHRAQLSAPALIGVGAVFDFLAGDKPIAPLWLQRVGMEWMFRLAMEPRRLWKRYAVTIPLFGIYVGMDWLGLGNFDRLPNRVGVGDA